MTDPASVIKLQVDDLIELQIIALKSSPLTSSELTDFHVRSAQLNRLFGELDRAKQLPPYPVHKSKHRPLRPQVNPVGDRAIVGDRRLALEQPAGLLA